MLLINVLILLIFLLLRIVANDDLCRLIEFDVPQDLMFFHSNEIESKLFYKTDYICQNKPVFRSLKYSNLYQFQAPNNRWWSLYDTSNSSDQLNQRQWCDAWNAKPLLSMSLGMFQHPLGKQKRSQRWQRVISNEKNNSYTYKPISNVHLKCYHPPPSTSTCQTQQLTFLFDFTETTNNDEISQMKLFTKTLIWLLYNQTQIALSYYRDTFHLISSFDNQTSSSSSQSLEYLFDSIDSLNQNLQTPKRFTVRWSEALHQIVTRIYKRRLLLPIQFLNTTDQSPTNDSIDDEIYTEPYPLIYSDEHAIKTILNITTYPQREKRAIKTKYDSANHVLVILTSRSKYLYDYKQQDRRLAQFISSVPLRIVVLDLYKQSNRQAAENSHSAFLHNAKYALASLPVPYNYIDRYDETGDIIHGEQLFDHRQRLCYPSKSNITAILMESKSNSDCSLLTLFDNQDRNSSLKDKFDYTFYPTSDQCFSGLVYRSLGDRNLYAQKTANGRWLIIRVDPLLPSTVIIQRQFASTTTSTLSPEFFYATDYANGPMMEDIYNETAMPDLPDSVPYCSDNPGLDIVWESEDSSLSNDYSLRTPRQWISNSNQSDLITPLCNKYKISCRTMKYDFLILIDSQLEYSTLIQTFFRVFLSLIDPFNHRLSLVVLSSTTIDTFQYHLPFTTINPQMLDNYFVYTNDENTSMIPLNQHIERLSEYLINNQQSIGDVPSKQILFTISSRLNFDPMQMKSLIQRYSSIRYMVLDPYLKVDDDNEDYHERERLLRSLISSPFDGNLFWTYASNRDLTFNTVFRVLESLCGSLR